MSDYNSALPIRSEADGADERVQVKLVDANNPDTQQMEVDTDGNAHVEMHGNDPSNTDRVLRTSELGALTPDGLYDVSTNTKPGNTGLIANTRSASPSDSTQTERLTSIEDSSGAVRALDISLHDESGEPYSFTNPLPVFQTESEGDEIEDYNTSSSVAKDASVNHDYTISAGKLFLGVSLSVSGSGKLKAELQKETAAASGVYNTVEVKFNSTANTNIEFNLYKIFKQIEGANVRVVITNRDQQAQDLYSTLRGIER